jgi:DNA-binding NarL/FixJ family response regulator
MMPPRQSQDRVECGHEFGVAVADGELDRLGMLVEVHHDVPRLLGDACRGRVGRAPPWLSASISISGRSGKNERMLRLGLVDDHPVARRGLEVILAEDPEFEIVAATGLPLHLPDPGTLDVVLCDLYLADGRPAVQEIRELATRTRVLVVSAASHPADVLACVAAGAAGYVTKDTDEESLRDAVRIAAAGDFYLSPHLADVVRSAARTVSGRERPLLTAREEEALGWIARGLTHSQTARRMGVQTSTVDTYVKRIRARLRLGNKAELVWFARNLADGGTAGDQTY